MNALDLVSTAIGNTFRAKTRSILTILAIFVGAFTLTLTSGLGTGINAYIDQTVTAVGASDTMTVTKVEAGSTGPASGPVEYNPDSISSGRITGSTVIALTSSDIDTITAIDGVEKVHATRSITPNYIQFDGGTRYVASVSSLVPGQTTLLAAGVEPDATSGALQVAIPESYVTPLGFSSDSAAIGSTVQIAITDANRTMHTVDATVVGVTQQSLTAGTGASILPNDALSTALFTAQSTGLASDQADRYSQATITFASNASTAQIDALKARLTDAGFTGTTVADQLGTITTVINGIVLVLNAFAIIALLAASFGIVNTLLMSVQERTREIGLMKAMGMGSGRVFTLFSLEAVTLGFLGSAIGAGIAMIVGSALSEVLARGLLSGLNGLTLIAFDPASIATIILVVMGIAFLAGTLPAARAARADPVESLRYE
ncbi:MAG: ABC transporter permease [Actinobacteria bacterium]|nr:ABC transporter permease [Actinomycetota bacterium]